MSQINLALRRTQQSDRFFRWQATVIAAFAGGSLTAGLINLGALIALCVTRSALSRAGLARRWGEHHA
jgi:hypothetical protein